MASRHSDSDNKTENHVHRNSRSVLPSPRSSTKRKRKADDNSQKESEPSSTLKSTKSRKIENQEKNLSPPTQTNTKTTTTKPPSRKKRRKYSQIPANTTTNQPTRSRVDPDLHPPSQPQPQPPPHSKRETQTDPASIPPRNGTSPFSRLPPELRQMILYRVFDVDEEAANRLPLGFDRFMNPVERARVMRFRLIRQRRDTLLMVEGEWGRVGVEWAGDARVVLEKVWKEVMGAESEVFG